MSKNGLGVVFNNIENQPSDALSGVSIRYKKNCCRQSDRRILPKVQQKNWGVSPGVYANENGAV